MFPDIRSLRRPFVAVFAGLSMALMPMAAAAAAQGDGFAQDRSDIPADPGISYGQLEDRKSVV